MFIINNNIKDLSLYIDKVWEIYGSVNQPIIALPEKSPEPTWAYVIAIRDNKRMNIFIYLFREQSREGVFYTYEDGEVELVKAKSIFNEALDFTGSMGFIMEKIELGDTDEQKAGVLKTVPAFFSDLSKFKLSSIGNELVLDTVLEDVNVEGKTYEIYNTKGGKKWLARLLSLF